MTEPENQPMAGAPLCFFGAVTRSLSHEINNVLAIINELSGLMGDYLHAADQGRPLNQDRMKDVVDRLGRQVKRGKGYVNQLNSLGHTVDVPRMQADARESFELIVAICQRFATLRKVTLESESPTQPVPMDGSPFDFQHIVYRCIDIALLSSGQDTRVQARLEAADDGVRLVFVGSEAGELSEELASRVALASLLSEKLGGKLDAVVQPGKPLGLTLELPRVLLALAFHCEALQNPHP